MILANSLLQIAPWALYRFSKKIVGFKNPIPLFFCYYIGFEHFHHVWDLSWPWLTLGNSLGSATAFAQFYEFTGVAGGSLWILGVAFALFQSYLGKNDSIVDEQKIKEITEVVGDNSLRVITPDKASEQVGRAINYLSDFLGLVSFLFF